MGTKLKVLAVALVTFHPPTFQLLLGSAAPAAQRSKFSMSEKRNLLTSSNYSDQLLDLLAQPNLQVSSFTSHPSWALGTSSASKPTCGAHQLLYPSPPSDGQVELFL